MRSLLSCRAWKQWDGRTDGQIVAAAQTKLRIPMEPGRKWGSTCHTEPPGNSLNTLALTSPGCRSRMPTVSTPHAIGINDFQKAEEQKDAKNVNTAQRADHTAGRRGEKGLPSLCEDFLFFLFLVIRFQRATCWRDQARPGGPTAFSAAARR